MSLAILLAPFFQQDDGGGLFAGLGIAYVCCLGIFALIMIAALWKVFEKAGQPGWAAIIPIYNSYIMLQIVGREIWWLVFLFIPGLNFIWAVVISLDIAKSFGKEIVWGLGLIILPFIFYPLLGFGDAQYQGPKQAF